MKDAELDTLFQHDWNMTAKLAKRRGLVDEIRWNP
jgi:hypothetical protein